MEELVLPSLPVLTAVANAQIDVPSGSDALRGLLVLHKSRHKPEGPLATRAAVIRSIRRETPSCFPAIRNHERVCQEVAAAALLGHELIGSTPRVVRPAARRALAALEVQRSARQVTVHSIATGASEVPRLVRPLVLLQCIGVAKLFPHSSHRTGLRPATHTSHRLRPSPLRHCDEENSLRPQTWLHWPHRRGIRLAPAVRATLQSCSRSIRDDRGCSTWWSRGRNIMNITTRL